MGVRDLLPGSHPRPFSMVHTYGDWPFVECECGEWLNPKTDQHCETVSLEELMKRLKIEKQRCPRRTLIKKD